MYLIAGFDVLYFSRFKIKTNPSFMVYSFLEKISTKWNAHILASSSKQDMFITNFNANYNANFLYPLYLLINKINWYLLTRAINTTCKSTNF